MVDGPDDPSDPRFDPGSFRDPLSRVVQYDGGVLRVLRAEGVVDFEALERCGFFAEAMRDGTVVATERIAVPAPLLADGWEAALRHEAVPVLTYPYEWTFTMLQDAALGQLRLARAALAEGMLTKDASAYNTQFVGARPVFIDIGSFERLRSGEPWRGYRQFCQLFYNPLLLQAARDVPFQPWLRGALEGITPGQCRALLGGRHSIGRGAFTHVVLHARAERANADSDRDVAEELRRAGFGPKVVDAQLAKLERLVAKLRWSAADSTWSGYSERSHYGSEDLDDKARFVRDVAVARRRRQVVDLGANDGYFSRVVAEHADLVVAVDSDAVVVDRLYRTLRDERTTGILPMWMDLTDPSPALGWRGRERASFAERVSPDLVLALALVHHLAISGTVPLAEVARFLADFGSEVVVEFPTPDDEMVGRLLRNKRSGLFDHYRLEAFERAVGDHFEVVRRELLPSGSRYLFHLAPR